MLIKNIITTTLLFVLITAPAVALQISASSLNDEKPRNSLSIHEDSFSCFQSLQCLQKENPFKRSNLNDINLNRQKYQNYLVEGSSKHEEIYAKYDGNGRLIEARLTQRNIDLPEYITNVLKSDDYKDWEMIGNELVVQNFDKKRMQYKVILRNDNDVIVEYFDKLGNPMNRLS
ncbi:hypothetical protein BH23BAC3_BH23BAC3_22550 [soil metagenome]